MSALAPAHQLFVAHVAYGHARPLLYLALNLLTMHPHLSITYLGAKQLASKLVAQLDRYGANEDVEARFHLVFFGEVEDGEGAQLIRVPDLGNFVVQTLANFDDAYRKVLKGDPLLDTFTNTLIPTFPAPLTRIVSDLLVLAGVSPAKVAIEAALGLSPERKIELVSLAPVSSSLVASYLFNPPDSIIPEMFTRCLEEKRKQGKAADDSDIYNKIAEQNDDVVHSIGGGDVYMYELQPSSARWRAPHDWLESINAMIQIHNRRDLIHGLIVAWEGDFTPPDARLAEIALKTFDNFWEVGPQLAPADWDPDVKVEEQTSGMGKDVMAFMDSALEEEGERSVLVISFGSLFTIPQASHIRILLATLLELNIRFVFAKGVCDDATVAEVQRQCANSKGRGMLATWIPQNAVLAHRATSFFLTHCGSNSVQESILHAVPMIAWPGAIDQPPIALKLSQVHKVAFELLQIRTEYNIGRPTRRGPIVLGTEAAIREEMLDVLTRMRGKEGEGMRTRVKGMREVMVRSRAEGGRSRKAMRNLGM